MSWSWLFDDFNRTASAIAVGTAPTGQTWVNDYGTLGIDGSGRLYCPAASGGGRDYIDAGIPDFPLTITLVTKDSSAGSELWIHFRTATPGASFWRFGAGGGTVGYTLQKFNNPTLTTVYSGGPVPAAGDVIEIDCSGSSITVTVNGSTLTTVTDAFNDTATQIGVELYSGGTNTNTFDNLDLPAAMTAAADFGIYVPNNTEIDAYLSGAVKDRFTVPDAHASGSQLAIAAWYDPAHIPNTNHTADAMLVSVDRVEVYDHPGGTLLLADDFTSLAAWSLAHNGSAWSTWPAGYAVAHIPAGVGDTSAMIYQAMPAGAGYLVLKGVRFSTVGGDASFCMALLNAAGGSTDTPFHGAGGVAPYYYRLFIERPGSADNTRADMAVGTSAQPLVAPDETAHLGVGRGWVVGAITLN